MLLNKLQKKLIFLIKITVYNDFLIIIGVLLYIDLVYITAIVFPWNDFIYTNPMWATGTAVKQIMVLEIIILNSIVGSAMSFGFILLLILPN